MAGSGRALSSQMNAAVRTAIPRNVGRGIASSLLSAEVSTGANSRALQSRSFAYQTPRSTLDTPSVSLINKIRETSTRTGSASLHAAQPLSPIKYRAYSTQPAKDNAPPPTNPAVEVIPNLKSFREWRQRAFDEKKSVGFIATLGALHTGHLSLVRRSLLENDLTVVSIFVNPTKFENKIPVPNYPSDLNADLALLSTLADSTSKLPVLTVFTPTYEDWYPCGIWEEFTRERGAFVEPLGYQGKMEGIKRPNYYRGLCTQLTKFFHAVQPTRSYLGQKDIQQAIIIRHLTRDLLFAHPTPDNVRIVPTAREPTGLPMSSRNVFLSKAERKYAAAVNQGLVECERAWKEGLGREGSLQRGIAAIESIIEDAKAEGVELKFDYMEMNDPEAFDVVNWHTRPEDGRPIILSGAVWVGGTRIIDNLLLGDWKGFSL